MAALIFTVTDAVTPRQQVDTTTTMIHAADLSPNQGVEVFVAPSDTATLVQYLKDYTVSDSGNFVANLAIPAGWYVAIKGTTTQEGGPVTGTVTIE